MAGRLANPSTHVMYPSNTVVVGVDVGVVDGVVVSVEVAVEVGVVIWHPANLPYRKASVISLITSAVPSHVASGTVRMLPKQPSATSGGAR